MEAFDHYIVYTLLSYHIIRNKYIQLLCQFKMRALCHGSVKQFVHIYFKKIFFCEELSQLLESPHLKNGMGLVDPLQ